MWFERKREGRDKERLSLLSPVQKKGRPSWFTPEQETYIAQHWKDHDKENLAREFNRRFKTNNFKQGEHAGSRAPPRSKLIKSPWKWGPP